MKEYSFISMYFAAFPSSNALLSAGLGKMHTYKLIFLGYVLIKTKIVKGLKGIGIFFKESNYGGV